MHPPPTPRCPSQLWCNTSGSPIQINTAWSPEHSRFTAQSMVRTSGGVFMGAEPTFHLNAKGQSFIFRQVLYHRCHFMIIFKDFYKWKNGVPLYNLFLCLWLESSLCRQYAQWVVSVSTQRSVCVCACMFTTLWLTLLCQTSAQWTLVYVYGHWCWCVINSTAVPCFSPWAAAGTSWSSGQVWWASRWAAACGPAAAATPDSKGGHNNTTPVNMTATAGNRTANGQLDNISQGWQCLSICVYCQWKGTEYNLNYKWQLKQFFI